MEQAEAYRIASQLLPVALTLRAGARHSASDNALIQQLHDLACELGAECPDKGMPMHPMLKAAVEAMVFRHPGHSNQKTHGNRRMATGDFAALTRDEETLLKFRKQELGRKFNKQSLQRIAETIKRLPGGGSRLSALGEATTYGNIKELRKLAKSGKRGISGRARDILAGLKNV